MKYAILILSLLILMAGMFIRVRKINYVSEISKVRDKKNISMMTILDRTVSSILVKKSIDKRFLTWIYLPFIKEINFEEKVRLFTEKMLFVFMWLVCMFILPFKGFSLLLSAVIGLALAFYFPDLNYFISRRKRSLVSEKELSLAVDVLTGMCESGLSVRSGLELSTKVLKSDLREDIKLFCSGTAMGKGKELILEELRKKPLTLAVFDFFQMLSRFEEVGSPVNGYLSELSARLREDQLFRA